jgi:endo-1,4-beta-mannosidase
LETLHTYDGGNHLISSGGLAYLNYDSGIPWELIYALPYNDMASIHIYSDGDRKITLPLVFTWARNRRMPLMIEEFGFPQEMGDEQRAEAFRTMFDLLHAYGVSGTLFWNLGSEVASVSHDINPDTPSVWEVIQQYAP